MARTKKETREDAIARADKASKDATTNQLMVTILGRGTKPDATDSADCGEGQFLNFSLYRSDSGHGGLLLVNDGHYYDAHYFEEYKREADENAARLGDWRHAISDALHRMLQKRNEILFGRAGKVA